MNQGLIVKAVSGFYYVEDQDSIRMCRARGVFKKKGIHPLVGDRVLFSSIGAEEGVIEQVLERSTELVRPPVANMDHALLAFSVREPDLSLFLLDRLLVEVTRAGLACTIAVTKLDLAGELETARLMQPYQALGCRVVFSSARLSKGADELHEALWGRKTVIAGQTGVGKSSLLNLLVPRLDLKSAEISQRLGRGRHTTRHVELFKIAQGTYVADTPGFSQLDFKGMKPEDLQLGFVEIRQAAKECLYRGCLHDLEEGCAVLQQVGEKIAVSRYESYKQMLNEVRKQFERRY